MPSLVRDGVTLSYQVHGKGPAILLTHGFSLAQTMWNAQIPALADRYTVVTWDLRGHGASDYPDDTSAYSEDLAVADMAALLDAVGASKAVVGGLSLGGYLSLSFYAAHPGRCSALMLFDTGPGYRNEEAREQWNVRARARGDKLEMEGIADAEHAALHRNALGLACAARGMLTQSDDRVMRVLPDVSVPTLVLVGENDTPFLGAVDYMAKKIPNATKVVIPGAGHVANLDQPEQFNRAVESFLRASL